MTYTVIITPAAEEEILDAFAYIQRESAVNAHRWLADLYDRIGSLELFFNRCSPAPEAEHLGLELRHLVFKSHRVIFRVEGAHTHRPCGRCSACGAASNGRVRE